MTKSELIKKIHRNTEYRYTDVEKIVNLVFDEIINELCEGEKVQISNFGSFTKSIQPAYIGVNANTGEKIRIDESYRIRFVSSANLKIKINKRESA